MGYNGRGKCLLLPERLLSIHRRINQEPLKIFSNQELGINSWKENPYMNVLLKLGLIESVPYVYNFKSRNGKTQIRHKKDCYGWRKKLNDMS